MPVVVELSGDLTDLEAKLKAAGIKVKDFGDTAEDAGKRTGDAFGSDLEKKLSNIEEATKRAADASETLAQHAGGMNDLAEGLGNSERVALGLNDVMGVLSEQFGVSLGPAQQWAQAAGDVAGGLEGIIGGGMALVQQIGPLVAGEGTAIASAWAHVTALYAQAAAFVAANLPMIAIVATLALLAAGVVLVIKHWDDITAKFPILGEAVDGIKTKFDDFIGWITNTLVPAIAGLYDPTFKAPLDLIVSYFTLQFDLVKLGIETVLGVIKGIVDIFMGVFTGDWDRAWSGVKQVVDSLWDGIKGAFNLGVKFFTDEVVPKFLSAGKSLGGALVDGIVNGLKGIWDSVSDITSSLTGALKSAIQSSLNWLHENVSISIPGFDPPGPGSIPGFDWHFPLIQLASGGIVTSPTIALIGEAGPEAVIPLRELQTGNGFSVTVPGASSGGGPYTTGPIPTASNAPTSDMEQAQAELLKLLKLLSTLDAVSQQMWLGDPRNEALLGNLRARAAGLPLNPYSQNAEAGQWVQTPWGTTVWANPDLGIWEGGAWQGRGRSPAEDAFLDSLRGGYVGPKPAGTPGPEGGATGSPSGPGSAGVANGGGAGAGSGGGGAAKGPSEDAQLIVAAIEEDTRWDKQGVTLLKQIRDQGSQPIQLTVNIPPGDIRGEIRRVIDIIADELRRYNASRPSIAQ